MKKMFAFSTKTIVAIGLGAALFMVLFMYVKIPSGIPETSFQTAYGLGAFFAALFGPVAGGLIAFIGRALSDSIQYGSAWWSWIIASFVACFLMGFSYPFLKVDEGLFSVKDALLFNLIQIGSNIVAWIVVAPVLDILIYKEPVNLVFVQGATAALLNSISTGVIATLLLFAYAKSRPKKGSLTKEG